MPWPASTTPSSPAAGWPSWRRWSACRCGSRRCTTASLPQIVFCLVLAREIGLLGAAQTPADGYVAKRFGLLVWGFAVVAVLPVLTIGGGLEALEATTLVVSTLVNVSLVYLLFRVHRREWLRGPRPLEGHPAR